MDNLEEVLALFDKPSGSKTSNKKRKWREIEQLREKFQLEKDQRDRKSVV